MADYGGVGGGNSLRDALMAYQSGAIFPPQTGSPQPGPPVPIPQQRPPMPVPLPPGGVNMPPNFPAAQQLYQALQANPAPQMAPGNYAQGLGLVR